MKHMVKATWRRDGASTSGDMSDIFVNDDIRGQVFKDISHGDWVIDLTANGKYLTQVAANPSEKKVENGMTKTKFIPNLPW